MTLKHEGTVKLQKMVSLQELLALGGRTSGWLSSKVAQEVLILSSFLFTLWFAVRIYF